MRPTQLLATALALSSFTAAWPWPEDSNFKGIGDSMLIPRQPNSNTNNGGGSGSSGSKSTSSKASTNKASTSKGSTSKGSTSKGSTSKGSTSKSSGSSKASTSGKSSSSSKASNGGSKSNGGGSQTTPPPTGKGSKGTTDKSSKTSWGNTVQQGRVSLMTPAVTAGPQIFPIGSYVTFGWNYTDLKATPAYVDVLASCSENSVTYTVAEKMAAKGSGYAVWNTSEYEHNVSQLPMASYTLIIKAHTDSVTATAAPGYLLPYNQYMFAMYSPQSYTPFGRWDCATCNVNAGIAGVPAVHTLSMVLGMATLTVLSFTWFATSRFSVF